MSAKAKNETTAAMATCETKPSAEALRRVVAILEVLAGQRTASEAAAALGISINHYYLLERKALAGLTVACELQTKGPRGPGLEKQLLALQRELEQCQRECLRQAALVRAAQRAVGLPAVPAQATARRGKNGKPSAGKGKSKTRKRRPQVRALRAAERARKNSSGSKTEAAVSHPQTSQPSLPSAGHVKEHQDETQG